MGTAAAPTTAAASLSGSTQSGGSYRSGSRSTVNNSLSDLYASAS